MGEVISYTIAPMSVTSPTPTKSALRFRSARPPPSRSVSSPAYTFVAPVESNSITVKVNGESKSDTTKAKLSP